MSGISRTIVCDVRHIAKHLPGTPQMQRLLNRGRSAMNDWNFVEVWIDPMLSPPYVLLLLGDPTGGCRVFDPAEGYSVVFTANNYDEAQNWLLEDEYEPIEGRLSATELF